MSARDEQAWEAVAGDGTDPTLLADVVAAVVDDESLVRRRLAEQLDRGQPPGAAVRHVAASRLLDDDAVADVVGSWRRSGVRVALPGDPQYPDRLLSVAAPPPVLAHRGEVAVCTRGPTVALVGARAATSYGRGVTAWLAEAAADAGVHVVSGGAVGIDAAAHGAAIGRPGRTTVVLGCGHGVAYPRPHARTGGLFDRVVDDGGLLLSEFLPDVPPRAHRVRGRNRLVAGLADVVVVVEGSTRSGSLITASAAVERGGTVMAVPGDVRARGSGAPHRLLAEGAVPCTGPADLLDALGMVGAADAATGGAPSRPSVLPEQAHAVLAQAWPRAVAVEDLARRAGVDVGGLLAALTRARMAGEVAVGRDGAVLRRGP